MKNLKKINQKSLFFIAGVLVVVAVLVSLNLSDKVFGATGGGGGGGAGGGEVDGGAGATCTLTGFAWSGYKDKSGIGWIGFGPQNNFRVDVDSNGLLNGHAWIGDNTAAGSIGWVKFGGLSGFPGTGGNATLNWKSGKMSGWARACSVFQNGCSGTLKNDAYRGGWDGWIKLSSDDSDNIQYGVSWNSGTQQFEGYAWGSKEVAGWISFAGNNPNYGVTFTTNTCKNAVGDGGGGFDYSVSIVDFAVGSNKSETKENYLVTIETSSSNPQEVEFTNAFPISVTNDFGDILIIKRVKDESSCTPTDGSCNLLIDIEYTTVSGPRRSFSTQDIPTQSGDIRRDGKLNITILGEGEAYCYPDPSFALINTPITWTVEPGDDLKNPSYEWSGSEELSGEGAEILKTYSSTGIKSASVKITHDAGEQTIICSPTVLIFSDILFEHL